MFSLRAHAFITAGLFAAMILLAIAGNLAISSGMVKNLGPLQTPARILFFAIFVAFGLSVIPLMVKIVVGAQVRLGNADVGMIKPLVDHQVAIVWAIWILILLGMAVALPFAIQQGFFSDATPADTSAAPADGPADVASAGTLVAAPGMTADDVVQQSTLKLERGSTTIAGGAVFDFKISGTGIELRGCRYYFMSTYLHDPARIESINIGVSARKVTRAQLEAADAALRALLKADGWLTGHEEYRTAEDQQLHGGKTRGEDGRIWLKGETIVDIESRRMDDPVAGEDAATAGQWIQFIDLRLRKDYPWIERYVFAPPAE